MYTLVTTNSLDPIVQYLSVAGEILDTGDFDDSKIFQVSKLVNLKHDIITNTPPTEDEIIRTKAILGD